MNRTIFAGASRYLGSVLVGVLFAPVLPDVAVDLFGSGGGRDALLRVTALLLVVVSCVVTYRVQIAVAGQRASRSGYTLTGLGSCEVLVVPIGHRSAYQPRTARTGRRSVIEWLVDSSRPQQVVAVGTAEVASLIPTMRTALLADGVEFHSVELSDDTDPAVAVADAQHLVIGLLQARSLLGRPCYVDITGGNGALTVAMLRVGALLGAECTYVSSRYQDNEPVPGTQKGSAFDPVTLFAPSA